ncbi:hypothetical protein Zmor_020144 [Zophobas morio]|uniref:Cathepsin propeptide inhibitor domain-containing protein n=1 Tax=Zophobas morio TaxID=2755281 RepID=A0AA38I2Q1_9CUCU|nr:hypothetical protein Zmor_020144 [Zophobas morio]
MFAAASPLDEAEIDRHWITFKKQYNKNYPNEEEEHRRKNIFRENLKWLDTHKQFKQEKLSWILGPYFDRTNNELRRMHRYKTRFIKL